MYDFFKQIAQKNYCQSNGVCSIHPSISSLQELLLSETRELSNYIVKLNEFKITYKEYMSFIVEILSIYLINTSFNEEDYLKLLKKTCQCKTEVKEKYIEYCKIKKLPFETLNSEFNIADYKNISELIKFSEENITNKQKGYDVKKLRLFELIVTSVRFCAINIVKIKKYNPEFSDFDYPLIRFFALTSAYSIRNEKIIRRIKEFSSVAYKIKTKLLQTLKEKYGEPEIKKINTGHIKGHCILVSGEDFYELESILSYIKSTKKDIKVYTHGDLFLAHFYPYFKNNKILIGHLGKNDVEYDFSTFPGAIFMTQNFNQKIDNLYRGELFSSKLISFKKVNPINNNDYSKIIESAKKLDGFKTAQNENEIEKIYKPELTDEYIENIINNISDTELIIIAGSKNSEINEQYENKAIININFPYNIELLYNIVEKCIQKNIKVTLFFTQCSKTSLENLLILLNKDIDIVLASCPYSLINPHVTESLKSDFNISLI